MSERHRRRHQHAVDHQRTVVHSLFFSFLWSDVTCFCRFVEALLLHLFCFWICCMLFQIPSLFFFFHLVMCCCCFFRSAHNSFFFLGSDEERRVRRLWGSPENLGQNVVREGVAGDGRSPDLTESHRKLWSLHGFALGRRRGAKKMIPFHNSNQTIEFKIQVPPLIPQISSPYSTPFLFSLQTGPKFNCVALRILDEILIIFE